jgi:hypothetical protein
MRRIAIIGVALGVLLASGEAPAADVRIGDIVKFGSADQEITGIFMGADSSYAYVSFGTECRINNITTVSGRKIIFAGPGAGYDSASNTIQGYTLSGEDIECPISEITHLRATFFEEDNIDRVILGHVLPRVVAVLPGVTSQDQRVPMDEIDECYVRRSRGGGAILLPLGMAAGLAAGFALAGGHSHDDDILGFSHTSEVAGDAAAIALCAGLGIAAASAIASGKEWKKISKDKLIAAAVAD